MKKTMKNARKGFFIAWSITAATPIIYAIMKIIGLPLEIGLAFSVLAIIIFGFIPQIIALLKIKSFNVNKES